MKKKISIMFFSNITSSEKTEGAIKNGQSKETGTLGTQDKDKRHTKQEN
jgi:hypothetical protein